MNKPTTKPTLSTTPNTPATGAASLLPVAGPAAIAPVAIAGGGVRWVRGALMRCFTSAAVLLVLAFSATGASAQSVTINPQGSGGANVRTFDAGGSLTLTAASISGLSSPFTYAWQHPNAAGTPAGVTFSRRDQSTFTITASPSVATVTFGVRLEVSGSTSAGPAINSASITIRNNNQSPTAAVGPNQTVNEGTRVTLLGSGNDPDGNNADLRYRWAQTAGPRVSLSSQTATRPTFTVPDIPPSASAPTSLTFSLHVRDAAYPATDEDTATVHIFIRPLFQETIDNQTYSAGNPITNLTLPTALSVTGVTNTYTLGSEPPGLSFNNRILSGTPSQVGTFPLTYTATGGGDTDTLSFSVEVTNAEATGAPTISGDPTEGEELTADPSGITDANGPASPNFSYQWNRRNGTTDTPISGATTSTYTLTAADIGEQITVTASFTDGGNTPESRISDPTAAVIPANRSPVASAGSNQTVDEGATVTLDGSGTTDPDIATGDTLTYLWAQTSGTTVTLNDASAISPTFTAPVRQTADDGELAFSLTVTDSENETSTATVTISVTNLPPVADAGEAQTVDEGEEVTLDGSGSSGLDGDGRTYAWIQTDGTTVTLSDETAISPTFTAPNRLDENADLEFMLTVTDLGGASDTDSVQIGVATDAPVRQQALKTGLAALGRSLAASATDAIGQRLKPAATGPETSAFSGLSLSNCIARAAQGAGESPWAGPDGNSDRSSPCALPSTEQLARSAFVISLNGLNGLNGKGNAGAGGGYWSLWGRGDLSRFEGRPQTGLDLDGDLTAGYLGLDYRLSSGGLVGVALSRSEGEIDYRSGTTDGALDNGALDNGTFDEGTFDEGTLDTSLNSVYPYGYWSPRAGLGLWGLLGVGSGDVTLSHRETAFATDLDMRMGALGLRQAVQTLGSFDLALKADAFVVELESENVPGLPAVSAQARRARLLLEASHSWQPYPDERLGTSLELGLRADGGDADKGAGAELGVGLEYSNSRLGLRAQWRAQGLLAHSASGFEEWGTSLNVEFDPGVSGQGLALTLAPTWGQAASGGAQALWQSDRPLRDTGLAPASAMRMDLDLSYGLNRDRRQLSPFASLGLADGVMQRLRLGLRLGLGLADELEMELFGGRNASENRSPEHLLGLTGRLRF